MQELVHNVLQNFKGHPKPPRGKSLGKKKVWVLPRTRELKTNFDDAMFPKSNEAGIVVVIRNASGKKGDMLFSSFGHLVRDILSFVSLL